jgi:hypothetical protein
MILGDACTIIVSNPQVKQLFTFNQFITMLPSQQISGVFNIYTKSKWLRAEWGVGGDGEREREQWIN